MPEQPITDYLQNGEALLRYGLRDLVIGRREGLVQCAGCPVFFAPNHGRRRFCTDSCRSSAGRKRRRGVPV